MVRESDSVDTWRFPSNRGELCVRAYAVLELELS